MFNFLTSNLQLPVDAGIPFQPLIQIYRYCPKTEAVEIGDNMQLVFATQDDAFNQLTVSTADNNSYFIVPTAIGQSFYQCQLQGYFDFTPEWYRQQPAS